MHVAVEGIIGCLGPGFDRHAPQVGSGPAQPSNAFISARLDQLVEAAIDDGALSEEASSSEIGILVVPRPPGHKSHQLDSSARHGSSHITADFQRGIAIMLEQIVVVRWRADRHVAIVLPKIKAARLVSDV